MLRPSLIAVLAATVFLSASVDARPTNEEIRERALKAFGPGGRGVAPVAPAPPRAAAATDLTGRASKALRDPVVDEQAALRRDVLRLLGYSTKAGEGYVFVSSSMDERVIQSYAREAMWAGFTLVVRGIPPNQDLNTYLKTVLAKFVSGKGATASMEIDPRLFDRYGVTRVPTIVWDESPNDELVCANETTSQSPDGAGGLQPVRNCRPADSSTYWKLNGQVTIDFALERFADAGSRSSEARLVAMREYLVKPSREQVPFEGDFDALDTPKQEALLKRAMNRLDATPEAIERSLQPIFEAPSP